MPTHPKVPEADFPLGSLRGCIGRTGVACSCADGGSSLLFIEGAFEVLGLERVLTPDRKDGITWRLIKAGRRACLACEFLAERAVVRERTGLEKRKEDMCARGERVRVLWVLPLR